MQLVTENVGNGLSIPALQPLQMAIQWKNGITQNLCKNVSHYKLSCLLTEQWPLSPPHSIFTYNVRRIYSGPGVSLGLDHNRIRKLYRTREIQLNNSTKISCLNTFFYRESYVQHPSSRYSGTFHNRSGLHSQHGLRFPTNCHSNCPLQHLLQLRQKRTLPIDSRMKIRQIRRIRVMIRRHPVASNNPR